MHRLSVMHAVLTFNSHRQKILLLSVLAYAAMC